MKTVFNDMSGGTLLGTGATADCVEAEPRAPAPQASLDTLGSGGLARVRHVGGSRGFRRRLMELGLVPGTVVQRLGSSLFGDPIRVRVRDTVVALRRHDARWVVVETT